MKRISALLLILFCALPLKAQKEEITKGSKIIRLRYDTFKLIPGVRNRTNFQANIDKAYDFYGFNGYETYFDAAQARPFYRGTAL